MSKPKKPQQREEAPWLIGVPQPPRFRRVKTAARVVVAASVLGGLGYGGLRGYEALTYSPPPTATAQVSMVQGPQNDTVNVTVTNNTGTAETVHEFLDVWSKYGTLTPYQASASDALVSPGSNEATVVVPPHRTVTTRLVGPRSDIDAGGQVKVVNGTTSIGTFDFGN